jgi:hypothetical protein
LKVHLHHFSKLKVKKKSQNSRNQGFSLFFCLSIEESGSGSIPSTNRSGSRRPKNMWIRIRIRNTGGNTALLSHVGGASYFNKLNLLLERKGEFDQDLKQFVSNLKHCMRSASWMIRARICNYLTQNSFTNLLVRKQMKRTNI